MYCILYSIAIAIRFVFVFAWLGWFQGRIRVGILYNIYNIIHNLCETSPKNLAKAALVLTRGLIYHLNESPYVFHLVHGWTRLAVSQTLAAIPLSSFPLLSLSQPNHSTISFNCFRVVASKGRQKASASARMGCAQKNEGLLAMEVRHSPCFHSTPYRRPSV